MMTDIGIVILAAGGSSRMGQPKQLLRYQSRTLIHHVAEIAIASRCRPILVVLGARAEAIRPALHPLDLQVLYNPHWSGGISTSIRTGVQYLQTEYPYLEAVLLMLSDQPLVSTTHLNALISCYRAAKNRIVASEYAGVLGVPAIFDHTLFPELTELKGDVGARSIIQRDGTRAAGVAFSKGAIDVDTPKDYECLLQNH